MLLFLGIITFVVFVHELGHYLMAKSLGIPVNVFSVGFGPKLLGFHAFGTHWKLCIIPLGGYVKLQGDEDYENEAEDPNSFWGCHPWKRIAIAVAGPAVNLLLPLLLFSLLLPFTPLAIIAPATTPCARAGLVALAIVLFSGLLVARPRMQALHFR